MPSTRSGRKSRKSTTPVGRGKKESGMKDDDWDEIDEVTLKQQRQNEEAELLNMDNEDSSEEEEAFAVHDDGDDDSEEDDDESSEDDDQDSSEDDSQDSPIAGGSGLNTQGWGKNKDAYYEADNVDYEIADDDEEDEELEEVEARRLQEARARELQPEDWGQDDDEDDDEENEEGKLSIKEEKVHKGKPESLGAAKLLAMTAGQRDELVRQDAPELIGLLSDIQDRMKGCDDSVFAARDAAADGSAVATKDGMAYMEMKTQLMLSYCLNIAVYLMLKIEGRKVSDHPVMEKLLETRLLLDKLRPVDGRLKYQIDKLLRIAAGQDTVASGDGTSFKPTLVDKDDDDEEHNGVDMGDEDEDGDFVGEGGVYKAPKVTAVRFDADNKAAERAREKAIKQAGRAAKSAMVKALREEFGDAPEEAANIGSSHDTTAEKQKEIQDYEEERFTRVTLTKKDRAKLKKDRKIDPFADFDDFADLQSFNNAADKAAEAMKKKRSLTEVAMGAAKEARKAMQRQKAGQASADADVPRRDRQNAISAAEGRRAKAERAAERNSKGKRVRGEDVGGNETYDAIASARKKVKSDKKERYHIPERSYSKEDRIAADERREAGRTIVENRGIVPHRSKDKKNPRKKHRIAFDKKSTKSRTSQYGRQSSANAAYGGESTGISKNISRSTKL